MFFAKARSGIINLSKRWPLLAVAVFFSAGIIFWGGFHTAMEATNTMDFCLSCHEMRSTVYPEYQQSRHYSNSSGVQATCPDCHVPREWLPMVVRKIKASRELYYWVTGEIDTRQKFEAKRLELAERVWHSMQNTDSRECRNCHLFSAMDLATQGRFAQRIHADAVAEKKTCIECHKGISHELPIIPFPDQRSADLDMEYAEEINETCAGCHGEYGEGSTDGEYPRLAGLDAGYLATQLRLFKSRERLNIPMTPYTTDRELPEEDVVLIATYLSRIDLPARLPPLDEENFDALARLQSTQRVVNIAHFPGDLEAGGRLYKSECAGCHAPRAGASAPPLVGQYSQYLLKQIQKFRNRERRHDDERDAEVFRDFSDAELGNIMAFLSVQDD